MGLLECLEDLECQEDQGCLEDQGCQEADTAIQDVFASICLATWGLEALGCPQCHQRALDLDLVPQDLLPLVAMEQLATAPVVLPRGRQGLLEVRRSRSTSGHGRLVWSGLAAPLSSVEQQSSAMSGF